MDMMRLYPGTSATCTLLTVARPVSTVLVMDTTQTLVTTLEDTMYGLVTMVKVGTLSTFVIFFLSVR